MCECDCVCMHVCIIIPMPVIFIYKYQVGFKYSDFSVHAYLEKEEHMSDHPQTVMRTRIVQYCEF